MVEWSPSALKRWIGIELKRLREATPSEADPTQCVSRAEMAARFGKVAAWPGHVETGRSRPSRAELEILLDWYGHPERLDFFVELLERSKRGTDWWIKPFDDAVPEWFNIYLGLESIVRQLSGYDAKLVHGLFQLPEYAESVIREVNPALPDAEVRKRVELRMARHEVLTHRTQQEPLQVWRVIDEAALRMMVGSTDVMRRQLARLLELAELPNVTIQVLPAAAGAHPGVEGAFTVMDYSPAEFGDDPGSVWIENRLRGTFVEELADIAVYRPDLQVLQAKAFSPAESVKTIKKVMKEIIR